MTSTRQALVVDDDAAQLQTLSRGLHCLGFACVCARSAREAQALLKADAGERFDLVIADLTFPGSPGARLLEQAWALRPDLPVLVITGLVTSPEAKALRARGFPLLRKPFGPEELGQAIDKLCGPPRGETA